MNKILRHCTEEVMKEEKKEKHHIYLSDTDITVKAYESS